MDKTYRFLSNIEPTDEQLLGLMRAATQEVNDRAAKAEEKYKILMQTQLKAAQEEWQKIQAKNGEK